jgi:hypothetical protein
MGSHVSGRRAECHPDRPLEARGFCNACYQRVRRRERIAADADSYLTRKAVGDRRYRHGLSAAEWDALWDAQRGCCAICQRALMIRGKAGLHVDHDHASGAVRALLCGPCNVGLGMFGEDTDRLEAAVRYLRAA